MNLVLRTPDWKYGTVLLLREASGHDYLYMFVYRKPRATMPDGRPNDRGFAAMCLGVPSCSGCRNFDHDRVGKTWASYGGLPDEAAWEVIHDA
jgi:hypothetical protein